jgi:hypothetical protein
LLDDELRNDEASWFRVLNKVDAEGPLVAAAGLGGVREHALQVVVELRRPVELAYTSSSESLPRLTVAALKRSASRDGTTPATLDWAADWSWGIGAQPIGPRLTRGTIISGASWQGWQRLGLPVPPVSLEVIVTLSREPDPVLGFALQPLILGVDQRRSWG